MNTTTNMDRVKWSTMDDEEYYMLLNTPIGTIGNLEVYRNPHGDGFLLYDTCTWKHVIIR